MFSERDLLVKYIFQELKVRARSLFVDIFEVDLRWGITEEQAQNNELVFIDYLVFIGQRGVWKFIVKIVYC